MLVNIIITIFLIIVILLIIFCPGANDGEDASFTHAKKEVLKNFKVTAYCPGACCNGKRYAGRVAIGRGMEYWLKQGYNICAVDPKVIPLKSLVIYKGKSYLAADTGSKVKGKHIDILLETHKKTVKFGVKKNQTIAVISY